MGNQKGEISELRREVQQLRRQFDDMLNNTRNIAYQINYKTRTFDYINPAITFWTGFSHEEYAAKTLDDLLDDTHPDDRNCFTDTFQKTEQVGANTSYNSILEYRRKVKDGTYHWYWEYASFHTDSDGSIDRIVGCVYDVSEMRKTNEALQQSHDQLESYVEQRTAQLQESETRYRALAETISDIVSIHDMNGEFIYVSPSCQKQIGWTLDDLKNNGRKKIIYPDDYEAVSEKIRQLIATGSTDTFTWRCVSKNKNLRWMETNASLVRKPDGTAHQLLLSSRNITDRWQADSLMMTQKDLSIKLSSTSELDESLNIILDEMVALEGIHCGGIYLLNKQQNALTLKVHRCLSEEFYNAVAYIPFGDPRMTQIMTGSLFKARVADLPGESSRIAQREGLKSMCSIPILFDNEVVGALNVGSKVFDVFPERTIKCLEAVISLVGGVLARVHAEEALRESEGRYRSIVESSMDGVIVCDENHTITFVNRRIQEMLGYSYEEIVGQHGVFMLDEFNARIASNEFARRKYNKKSQYDLEMICKDGSRINIIISSVPLFDEAGRFQGSLGMVKNITERKKAEHALRDSEARWRALVENIPFDFWAMDTTFTYTMQNKASRSKWGNIVGKNLNEIELPESLRQQWLEMFQQALNGKVSTDEFQREQDGHLRLFSCIIAPIRVEGSIAGILGLAYDITDRVLAEHELRESEERFRSILEGMTNIAVQGYGPDGIIHYWNKASEKIYGYTEQEALGKSIIELIIPPGMKEHVQTAMNRGAKTGITPPAGEHILIRKDGSPAPVFSSHAVVFRQNREPELYCIDVDLRELKEAQSQLEEFREKMIHAEQLASLGTLSATVAHELNQPLTVLQLLLQQVRRFMAQPDPNLSNVQENINESLEEVIRASQIVNRFREFARKATLIDREQIDLARQIRRIVDILSESAHKSGLKINLNLDRNLGSVYFNKVEMQQIFLVLIQNAIQAADSDQTQQLNINIHQRNGQLQMEFKDTCSGIKPEDLEHIFKPFFTTKPASIGTGLGLCIVERIIKKYNGTIRTDSEFGTGTVFQITLPMNELKP